jgi:hypothetical protein
MLLLSSLSVIELLSASAGQMPRRSWHWLRTLHPAMICPKCAGEMKELACSGYWQCVSAARLMFDLTGIFAISRFPQIFFPGFAPG